MLIRRETHSDLGAIDEVHRRAFALEAGPGVEPVEVGLVRALRADPAWVPALSLVAERDGGVIGHIVVTRASVAGGEAAGLGPVGVLPTHQGAGVGSALMHAVLGAADALDIGVVALLGHTGYYPRFGFVLASDLGIAAPDPEWGAHFQARPLAAWNPALAEHSATRHRSTSCKPYGAVPSEVNDALRGIKLKRPNAPCSEGPP